MNNTHKILLAGGGSGGHLTPLVAVANSLKILNPEIEVSHIGQSGELLQNILDNSAIDSSYSIKAGKFRRYNGETFLQHLVDYKTILLNFRDIFRFLIGTVQAWVLLGRIKPNAIMLKGGFVCVPVGIAARLRKIPYITHDSDAVPGLANRITAKHAIYNTVAMDPENYPYKKDKTLQVGIPIQPEYKTVDETEIIRAKESLGIDLNRKVLFCVGGGLGARNLNTAIVRISKQLISEVPSLYIIHLTGKSLYEESRILYEGILDEDEQKSLLLLDFSTELFNLSKVADVIISRGGATNIAEFAAQEKACIIVPNPVLTGGQQLHNADVLKSADAALIVSENDEAALYDGVVQLFKDNTRRGIISKNLHKLSVHDSADMIAKLLIKISDNNK